MTKRYVEIYLGSPDGLKGLIQSSLSELLGFYRENLWYGLSEEVMNYIESLDFLSVLEPANVTQERYIDRFIEYAFEFYGEHHEFSESLGNVWCTESEISHIFSITGRRIFSGYGVEFDTGNKSTNVGYLTNAELQDISVSDTNEFLAIFNSARQLAISRECGLVYTID